MNDTWTMLEPKSDDIPDWSIAGKSKLMKDDVLYVFGGYYNYGSKWKQDIWKIDIDGDFVWEKVPTDGSAMLTVGLFMLSAVLFMMG